jgi:hypothetical protein
MCIEALAGASDSWEGNQGRASRAPSQQAPGKAPGMDVEPNGGGRGAFWRLGAAIRGKGIRAVLAELRVSRPQERLEAWQGIQVHPLDSPPTCSVPRAPGQPAPGKGSRMGVEPKGG